MLKFITALLFAQVLLATPMPWVLDLNGSAGTDIVDTNVNQPVDSGCLGGNCVNGKPTNDQLGPKPKQFSDGLPDIDSSPLPIGGIFSHRSPNDYAPFI